MDERTLARFFDKVEFEPNSGCWLWCARFDTHGYGQITVGSRTDGSRRCALAHRLSYEHFSGTVPAGALVCHRCDVRCCVNPDHLFLGSDADNNADMHRKGRHRAPRGSACWNSRLTEPQALEIIRLYRSTGMRQADIAARFGVSQVTVSHLIIGRSWKHLPRE